MATTKKAAAKDTRSKTKKQNTFLEKLPQYASVNRACRLAKVPRTNIYHWLKTDAAFKKKYAEANATALQTLEDEAVRRAFEGTVKPVYYQGKKIGTIREFSDSLLLALLKAKAPHKYKTAAGDEVIDAVEKPRRLQILKWGDREIRI